MNLKKTDIEQYSIEEWVQNSPDEQKEFRQAVHTILIAVAGSPSLRADMIIKGGILLAIRYRSHRYTKDIDFSTSKKIDEIKEDMVQQEFNASLSSAVELLDYDLDCLVQSCKVNLKKRENKSFHEIAIKVGYAYRGTNKHKRLMKKLSPTAISIDYSTNEPIPNVEKLIVGDGKDLIAYNLTDLMAEKFRALIQQSIRNRTRRQDIYDLFTLVEIHQDIDAAEKKKILESLLVKASSRNIEVNKKSFQGDELKARSAAGYLSLADEIQGELPDFEKAFSTVKKFYESLPWQK